jgi:hypothetical protein
MPPSRYALRSENRTPPLLGWAEMDGFFVGTESAWEAYENPTEEPGTVQVTLRGFDWLDAATDRPTRTLELGDTVLEVRSAQGRILGDYSLWETRLTVPAGASEATLTAAVGALPQAGAEWSWEQWRAARPSRPNVWAELPEGRREGWLEVAQAVALREHRTPYPALTDQIQLDGRHIDDLASFFCALGEALAGPGGWCASNVSGLTDCLRFAPRATARPQLVWREMAVAEHGLARKVEADGRTMTYFELISAVLADGAVDVVPA